MLGLHLVLETLHKWPRGGEVGGGATTYSLFNYVY